MLTIHINGGELFNEETEQFVKFEEKTLVLEHSLVALSKWESNWELPFLSTDDKTTEQTLDYIWCMVISGGDDLQTIFSLSQENLEKVNAYIDAKMTATWFADTPKQTGAKEIITSEIIYYWLVALQIPWDAQYWHLNRLLTLVRVVNAKNAPKDKKKAFTRNDLDARREMNRQRKAAMGTNG